MQESTAGPRGETAERGEFNSGDASPSRSNTDAPAAAELAAISKPMADEELVENGAIDYASGDVYEGAVKIEDGRSKPHGRGICRYANGDTYEGEWKDGLLHGEGTFRWKNGEVYEGQFEYSKKQGKGVYHFATGEVYDGEWKDDLHHGVGTKTLANGDLYQGQWVEHKGTGRGSLTWADGSVYEGEFEGCKMHGKGALEYENGNVYEGEFENGKKNGSGTLAYASGDVYEGQWKEGKQNGTGTLKYSSGGMYEGNWTSGQKTEGKLTFGKYALSGEEKRKSYDEREVRSKQSQQGRLQTSTKTCENCGADDGHYKLRVCSGCGLALYCSVACQKAARGSHQRICDIRSELPPTDAVRLALRLNGDGVVDFDACLRYATKYMSNLTHLELDVKDGVKLSAKRLSSFLSSKNGELESFVWKSTDFEYDELIIKDETVWKELRGLKQLSLHCLKFDQVLPLQDVIYQQRNHLTVLCLPFLNIPWSRAKFRRAVALAVNSSKNLVILDLDGCVLMDSDLKIMLHGLPNLRILSLKQDDDNSHQFTDKSCGLIARKCPGLQELNLDQHTLLSVRGVRKILEGCTNLRFFRTMARNLSCGDIRNLLEIAPQLICLSFQERGDVAREDLDRIIEATGGRTVLRRGVGGDVHSYEPQEVSVKTREKYQRQNRFILKDKDPLLVNMWEDLWIAQD